MSNSVIIHIKNAEPMLAEIDEMPQATDVLLKLNNPRQKDADNDNIGDACDDDTIYGYALGDFREGINVSFYEVSCGVTQPYSTLITDEKGYYAIGGLTNGQYLVLTENDYFSFEPGSVFVQIPQTEIQSHDFTATAD